MEPFALCLTGTSGSGKTTLANAVAESLRGKVPLQVIDGDILRGELGNLFGYTKEERRKQTQVVKVLAKYLLRQHVNVLIAIVAPYDDVRKGMREFLGEGYVQVYVNCPYEVREARDVKGYYRLARENRIQNLNGADDPYEAPEDAELELDTSRLSVEACVDKILACLRERGYGV